MAATEIANANRYIFFSVAVVCALLGFALGRLTAPAARTTGSSTSAKAEKLAKISAAAQPTPAHASLADVRIDQLSHVPASELRELLSNRDNKEIAELARKFEALAPNPQTYANLRPFFKTWAQMDETAAFQCAVAFKDVRFRGVAIDTIAQEVSPDASGRVVKLLRQQPKDLLQPGMRDDLLGKAIANWSQNDPAAATQLLEEEPDVRRRIGASTLQNWGWIEGPAALAWLDQHPSTDTSEFSSLFRGWIEKDPIAASTYIADHLDDSRAQETLDNTVFCLYYVDKPLASSWVQKLSSPEARIVAETELTNRYAADDPKAAVEWSMKLQGEERKNALSSVTTSWSMKDPDAALKWINNQTGNLRDESLATFCETTSAGTPEKAIEQAYTISDSKLRDSVVQTIVSGWVQDSPEQAQAWIRSSNLPAKQKAELLSRKSADDSP